MIYLSDSQNSWDFSKPSEHGGPELGAGAWVARGPLTLLQWLTPPCMGPGLEAPWCPPQGRYPCLPGLFGGCVHQKASLLGGPSPWGSPLGGLWHGSWGGSVWGSFIFSWAMAAGHSGYICTEDGGARAGAGSFPAPWQNLIAPARPRAASRGEVCGGG